MRQVSVLAWVIWLFSFMPASAQNASSIFLVDYRSLVSRADLNYDTPVDRSEEGMPVGNGRMGSLVWTTPSAMHFQINRCDVFAEGCNTNSFPQGSSDYASGCGYVDINLVDFGPDVFAGSTFQQHLSVYDGLMTAKGNNLSARVLAWNQHDIMAVEIDDQRPDPSAVSIDLRMLRYLMQLVPKKNFELASHHAVMVRTAEQTATSKLDIREGRILLTQEFRENDFYDASVVAISVIGRPSKAVYYNESTVRLSTAPGQGKFTILVASAASRDPKQDVGTLALKELNAAESKGFDGLLTNNQEWWHDFWAKAFIHLHSADGIADYIEQNYTYFLYIMGSSSRGAYMPRYGGMLWYTTGDMRQWGSQFWWHNQGCYYNGLAPANRFELLDPVFSTYSSAIDSYALAAKQQWGSQGIWIPETTWFDGLENLPDDITAEMRDLYLARKPWEQRSQAFRDFSQRKQIFNARWNWLHYSSEPWKNGQLVSQNWPTAPFAYVTHIFSSTAKIAYVYWLRYQYTEDKTFLRNRAYPVIKGAAEFYRNFPNMRKGDDGKFHITHISNHESNWNSNDSIEELTAMHAILPMAISAAKTLGMDTDLQEKWKDLYANLAPIPTGIVPSEFYDMCTVGTGDREMLDRLRALPTRRPINAETRLGVLSREAIAAANLGLADRIKFMIPGQMMTTNENIDSIGVGPTGVGVMRNRLGMREGPGCLECQRLGNASYALHSALLQSVPPTMDGDPVIYVFPAWPKEWDAQYTLAARGAFLVSASMEGGEIKLVEIHSQLGGKCRLSNPWPEQTVTLYRNGKKGEQLSGGLLDFSTQVDEIVAVVMGNNTPSLQRVR